MEEEVKAVGKSTRQKPSYLKLMEEKFTKWTGIDDEDANEAINDFSGDLYLEMRKLTSRICTECEQNGVPDEVKDVLKDMIDETWRDIIDHQKIGLDKLCIVIKRHINK